MKSRRAFTLIELMIVVGIIAILTIIAVPNFQDADVRSKVSGIKNNMRSVALKLEVLNVDTNRYALVGKWRTMMYYNTFSYDVPAEREKAIERLKTLYGPHQDVFEATWLKGAGLYDSEWLGSMNRQHLFNGFMFFLPKNVIRAIDHGNTWQGCERENWVTVSEYAGEWLLYSCGPDLRAESPNWIENYQGRHDHWDQSYVEKRLFHEYDPTNGTVSYGNIFRTQKNPAGLGALPGFYE